MATETPASPRVVAIGGGTGLAVTLAGLKTALFAKAPTKPTDRERLTAIVNVVDDGGSSGRLRRSFAVPPPGDVRNCLLALAEGDPTLAALFRFRFAAGDVGGHSLGNLVMTALAELGGGDFRAAVEHAGRLLDVRGRVLPATVDKVVLVAEFTDGTWASGESRISKLGRRIRRVRVQPHTARALPEVCAAVAAADLIVLGPGSLYTSIIPVLLLPGVAEAIARSNANVALVANLMTEPGETDGYSAEDGVRAIRSHAPAVPIHHIVVNKKALPRHVVALYERRGATRQRATRSALEELGCAVVEGDVAGSGPLARHDPDKLAVKLLELVPAARSSLHRALGG